MTEPYAAFTATFVKTVPVGGRRVVQFVFEVATEKATEALTKLGGFPTNMTDIWCAIVRLNPGLAAPSQDGDAPQQSTSAAQAFGGASASRRGEPSNRYAQRAGILCNDPRFQGFLIDRYAAGCKIIDPVERREWAADKVRELCEVDSRADIQPNTPAANRFDILESAYLAEMSI